MSITFRCARCEQLLQMPAEETARRNARCPTCRLLMHVSLPAGMTAEPEDDRPGLPWEQTRNFGALLRTAWLVCFRPGIAFSQMKQSGSLRIPILYSLICVAIGFVGTALWSAISTFGWLTYTGQSAEDVRAGLLSSAAMSAAYILLGAPLIATLGNLMAAGLLHICLIFAGGSGRPFATSFRLVCYSQSSLMLWLLYIPLGEFIVFVWNLVLTMFAVHKAHEVPANRAVIAALLPLAIGFGLVVISAVIFIAVVVVMAMNA